MLPPDTIADNVRLAEIDENLARGELSPAERAIHIDERKKIYEKQNGPAKAAGARGSNKKQGKGQKDAKPNFGSASFTADTAKKTGRSKSSVQADATRAKSIPNLKDCIGTSLDKGDELDALAKRN